MAGLPSVIAQVFATYISADTLNLVLFGVLTVVTIVGVVVVSEGQRNIPQYARGGAEL